MAITRKTSGEVPTIYMTRTELLKKQYREEKGKEAD
jgi:hypothetical protein